jgi:hypothetical protein
VGADVLAVNMTVLPVGVNGCVLMLLPKAVAC